MVFKRCCLLLLGLGVPMVAADGGLGAVALDRLKAATVFVFTRQGAGEASGSGFVVRSQGDAAFIVTNDHVARPDHRSADITVVLNSGGRNEREYPARLVGDDPVLDLAILEIDGSGLPASLPVSKTSPRETQSTYVLGFPFGEDLASSSRHPSVTVGQASISSLRMDDDGQLSAIQLDGALNPGNSGGPVVDPDGNVLGVAVAAVLGSQIGFVIPAQRILEELDGRACVFLHAPIGPPADGRVGLQVLCSDPFHKITAVRVLVIPAKQALSQPRLDAHGAVPRMAGDVRQVSLARDGDAWSGPLSLQLMHAEGGDYLVQGATTSSTTIYSQPIHVDFSVPAKVAARPAAPPAAPPAPSPSRRHPRGRPGAPGQAAPGSQERLNPAIAQAAADCLPAAEPGWRDLGLPPAGEPVTTPLPGVAADVVVGDSGRFVAVALPDQQAIAIYDADKLAIRMLRLPSNIFEMAAGGTTLLIFYKAAGILTTYDLASGEKLESKRLPFDGDFDTMVMGRGRGDRALFRILTGGVVNEHLLDVGSLSEVPIGPSIGGANSSNNQHIFPHAFVHVRSDSWMNCVGEWSTSESPNGLGSLLFGAGRLVCCENFETHGWVAPGDDERLYCADGSIFDRMHRLTGTIPGQSLIPACGGILFLGLGRDGGMTVFPAGSTTPVVRLGAYAGYPGYPGRPGPPGNGPEWRLSMWTKSRFQFDKQVVLDAVAGRLITMPMTLDAITQRPINLKALLEDGGADYLLPTTAPGLLASPDKLYQGQLHALSKLPATFSLSSGPVGMTVSPSGGLRWTPSAEKHGGFPVVITITSASRRCVQTFTVYVN